MDGYEKRNKEKFFYCSIKWRGLFNIINDIIIIRWREVGIEEIYGKVF